MLRSAVVIACCAHAQDVLAVGHSGGVSTLLVPGAGEPNLDSHVADPFAGRRARREAEVHQLLDKLQPEMIVLDPSTIAQARPPPQCHCNIPACVWAATEPAGMQCIRLC